MTYKWSPIAPLGVEERKLNLSDVDSLVAAWRRTRATYDPRIWKKFHDELIREWSIETGVLEHLYDIDEGATRLLIEEGFIVEIVDRSKTSISAELLIAILSDHRAAAELLMNGISGQRTLSKGVICELHSILTRNQDFVEGIDSLGRLVRTPLERGAFKKMPNNPTRPDNSVHEYCPPVQVESEMENLVKWYDEYHDVQPLVKAAWLHHRFTQIHPFADGNGRVARGLVMLVLLQADFMPIVIRRDDRKNYLSALEKADEQGKLDDLVALFQDFEERACIRAISIKREFEKPPEEYEPQDNPVEKATAEIVESLKQRPKEMNGDDEDIDRKKEKEVALDIMHLTANLMSLTADNHLEQQLQKVAAELNVADTRVRFNFVEDMEDLIYINDSSHVCPDREDVYRPIIHNIVERHNYSTNLYNRNSYLSEAMLAYTLPVNDNNAELAPTPDKDCFSFVFSLHSVGPEREGIMAGVCFYSVNTRSHGDEIEIHDDQWEDCTCRQFIVCLADLAKATNTNDDKMNSLKAWLDLCLGDALRKWRSKYLSRLL